MKAFLKYFWPSLILSLFVSSGALRIAYGDFQTPVWWWCWGFLIFNAGFILFVNHQAIGADLTKFLLFALLINSFRILVLITGFIGVYVQDRNRFEPLVLGVMAGYFCFLFGEVMGLRALSQERFERK